MGEHAGGIDEGVIFCQECARPWGARGHDQDAIRRLLGAVRAWWYETCVDYGWEVGHNWEDVLPRQPDVEVRLTEAVWFSLADVEWLTLTGNEPEISEPPVWHEWGDWGGGVPSWWAHPRRKPFVRASCCDLPYPPEPPAEATVSGYEQREAARRALGFVRVPAPTEPEGDPE